MKNKKIVFTVIFILVFVFSVIIPTFSRFKFKDTDISWDGLPSSGFKKGTGTLEDPYIISNANEFAFFALSTKEDDYDGKYIKLTGDIVINNNGSMVNLVEEAFKFIEQEGYTPYRNFQITLDGNLK